MLEIGGIFAEKMFTVKYVVRILFSLRSFTEVSNAMKNKNNLNGDSYGKAVFVFN
jgi:hypothetical protein